MNKLNTVASAVVNAFEGKVTLTFSEEVNPDHPAEVTAFHDKVAAIVDALNAAGVDTVVWGA